MVLAEAFRDEAAPDEQGGGGQHVDGRWWLIAVGALVAPLAWLSPSIDLWLAENHLSEPLQIWHCRRADLFRSQPPSGAVRRVSGKAFRRSGRLIRTYEHFTQLWRQATMDVSTQLQPSGSDSL